MCGSFQLRYDDVWEEDELKLYPGKIFDYVGGDHGDIPSFFY